MIKLIFDSTQNRIHFGLTTDRKVCKGDQGRAWNRTALLVIISHCYLWQEFINSFLWLSTSTNFRQYWLYSTTYPPTKERSGSYITSILLFLFLNFYSKIDDIARSLFITSGSPG